MIVMISMIKYNTKYHRLATHVELAFRSRLLSRCAMVFGGVVSRDGLELGCIGAPSYRARRSDALCSHGAYVQGY